MAWRFLLEDRLDEFNRARESRGRSPLRWADVSFLIGASRQSLQNLASNRELKVTNTRLLDSLCRFFHCGIDQLLEPAPELGDQVPDEEIDRLLAVKQAQKDAGIPEREFALESKDRPPFHLDALYGPEVRKEWKAASDDRE
jgi:hypothetical protein